MKKILLFSLIIILRCIDIFALDLNNEYKLERVGNKPFGSIIYTADFDLKNRQLLLLIDIPDILPMSQGKSSYDKFIAPIMFSEKGKYISKIGEFNSYEKNGIISVFEAKIIDDKINIHDFSKGELLIFSSKKPYKYLFSIKDINKIGNKYWHADASFIKENTVFFRQTQDSKTIIIGKNKILTDIDEFKIAALGTINKSKKDSTIKIVSNIKRFLSYKKYFDSVWYNEKLKKNKKIKKYIKKMKKFNTTRYSLLYLSAFLGIYLENSIILGINKDSFYCAHPFGTEIYRYNILGNLIDKYPIMKVSKYKKGEINTYIETVNKKLKIDTNLDQFRKKYYLSHLVKGISDTSKNNLILYYHLNKYYKNIFKIDNYEYFLLVYSLDKRKAISDFIPIDFTPVAIDSEKRELIGVQQRDGDIYLQFYKWDY